MRLSIVSVASLLAFVALPSNAAEYTGTIQRQMLNGNSAYSDRGVCVTLAPALPGTQWACLYKNNPLYKEISAFMLAALHTGKQVLIYSDGVDTSGHRVITSIE